MKLLLVQHGDALSTEVDPERSLSECGRKDVERVAAFLQRAGVRVQQVRHSGKRRAEQSAAILGAALLPAGSAEPLAGLAPHDEVALFGAGLAAWSEDTLVVGHIPFMARLVALLVCGDAQRELVLYQPGGVVCLERSAAGVWAIHWMLRPELL